MFGMYMRHDGWAELVNDEKHGGCLIPMMMLYDEHDEDPEIYTKPISPEQREEIIVHMAAGWPGAYQNFRSRRETYAGTHVHARATAVHSQGGEERSLAVWLRDEVQALLRRATVN